VAEAATNSLGSDSIPGDSPAGINARYEPEFEQLQAEVGKLENPAGGEIRWSDVVDLSRKLLEATSKDMLVATYYTYGLLQQQGYQGLLEGLATIYSMCTVHWENLFPELKRMRARESALDWLIDRVQNHLENEPPPASTETSVLESAVATVDELTEFLNARFETPNPKLAAFSRALAGKAAEASGGGGESQEAAPAGDAPAPQHAADTGTGGGNMSSGPITNRKVAFERLKEVADYLRRTEPHSPVAYLVQRAIKWGDMPLENVIAELVKNNDVRKQIMETLGVKDE
jgi:type VI secretion system protein VasJ